MASSETNEIYLIMIVGILIMLSLALAFVLFFQWSKRRIYETKLLQQDQQIQHQEELIHRSILVQEEERQRIAKDLHDDIGSKLNVLSLYLSQIKSNDSQSTIADMYELIDTTLASSRRISHDLLPPTLEKFGLATALHELCEQYQQSELTIRSEIIDPNQTSLPSIVALNLFRIVQELFNNTLKYAEATQIHLKADISATVVTICYQDNGKGFDPTDLNHQKGLGMSNIKSRMKMIDGSYELQTAPNEGVKVTLRVTKY